MLILALGTAMYWAIRQELHYELEQRVVTERGAVLREAETVGAGGLADVVADRTVRSGAICVTPCSIVRARLRAGWNVTAIPKHPGGPTWRSFWHGEPDDTRAFTSRTADGGMLIVGADPEAIEELDGRIIPLFAVAFSLITAIGVIGAFLLSGALRAAARGDQPHGGRDHRRRPGAAHAALRHRRRGLTGCPETLNQMLDRIAGLLDNLQVSGDIAHDLRTPLRTVASAARSCARRQWRRAGAP